MRFSEPPVEIDLRDTPSKYALAKLRVAGFGGPFAVITAFDPGGRNLSDSENEERRRDLNRRLEKTGYRFVAVDACSPDRLHCECSVAVVMKQKEALALARVLEQVAFFWFDGSRFWILGAIAEADPLELPRRS